jgi:hypothetical protein
VPTVPVVGASWMFSVLRSCSENGGQSRDSLKILFGAKVSSTRVVPCTVQALPLLGPSSQVPVSQRGQTRVRFVM